MAQALTTWTCTRPNCGTHNVADWRHCRVCHAPKPEPSPFRQALAERRIPPVDLEDFCRRHFSRGAKRHLGIVDIVDNQVFLTLVPDPDRRDPADPAIYQVDENGLTPCDNFGRPGW